MMHHTQLFTANQPMITIAGLSIGTRAPLLAYLLGVAVPMILLAVAVAQPFVPLDRLLQDPIAVIASSGHCCHVYDGAMSSLGVLIWCGAAAICMFTALVFWVREGFSARTGFMAIAGTFTAVLTLDDLFMLHDIVLPRYGVPPLLTYASYAALALAYLVLMRREIIRHDVLLFVAAGGLLAVSILIDQVYYSSSVVRLLLEDGAKFLGICIWATFHIDAALRMLTATPLADSRHPLRSGDRGTRDSLPDVGGKAVRPGA